MDFTDPTVRRVSQGALIALMLALLGIAALTAWVVQDWDGQVNHSESLVKLTNALPRLAGEKTSDFQNLIAILLGALPLMVASVCFSQEPAPPQPAGAPVGQQTTIRRLNWFGTTMTVALLVALVLAAIGYLGVKPTDWQDGHRLGLEGLLHAQQWARTVLSVCVVYLSALLGIKATK